MGRASSSSSSDSSSSSSHERKKRKREKEKKHKRKRKSESKKRRKREDDPERERLKEARRLLKRRTRAADEALVPSAAAEKKRKPNREAARTGAPGGLALPGAAGETPLTAAQEAAARVAAARAAALQEDAALERLGAPREDVLGFRNANLAGLAGLDADAAAPSVGASSLDARRIRQSRAERLEALLPAPATGREALFEKRAAARASNREMANAKEEGMFASSFGGELGGGGADEFRAALAANRMKREARNRRRGEDGASAALRLREHRRAEAEKMGAFQEMVGGLGEGERIEIPRRE